MKKTVLKSKSQAKRITHQMGVYEKLNYLREEREHFILRPSRTSKGWVIILSPKKADDRAQRFEKEDLGELIDEAVEAVSGDSIKNLLKKIQKEMNK